MSGEAQDYVNDNVVYLRQGLGGLPPAEVGPLQAGGGGGTYDGMDPWQQSVETRLGGIGQDIRDLRGAVEKVGEKVDNRFFWLLGTYAAGFMVLAGLIGKTAHWW